MPGGGAPRKEVGNPPAIGGHFKNLRDHLSNNASHLEFGPESMQHLLNLRTGKFRPIGDAEFAA
jgi:hypothetical protein